MSCIVLETTNSAYSWHKHRSLSYEVEIKLYIECRFIGWVCEELAYYVVSHMEIEAPAYHSQKSSHLLPCFPAGSKLALEGVYGVGILLHLRSPGALQGGTRRVLSLAHHTRRCLAGTS